MAVSTSLVVNPGILGDGFQTVDPSNSAIYRQRAKYGDPQAPPSSSKMARLYFNKAFVDLIANTLSSVGANGASANDAVYKKLSSPNGYFEFFLQNADEVFEERFQIVETLGDKYAVFGIGSKPHIFNFSGALINSVDNDWRVNFIHMFRRYISISRLAKFRNTTVSNVVTLKYDSFLLDGAILSLRTGLQANNEMAIPFSFPMLVTKWDAPDMTKLANPNSPTPDFSGSTGSQTPQTTKSQIIDSSSGDQQVGLSNSSFLGVA